MPKEFHVMVKKLQDYPALKAMLEDILFQGKRYSFEVNNRIIDIGVMFGFAAERHGDYCQLWAFYPGCPNF